MNMDQAAELRAAMLNRLQELQGGRLPHDVVEAMTVVPRHVFVPDASLTEAYGLGAVVTHRDADGVATSSASAAGTVAGMLRQAEVRPGQRVLEIGAGTGYNAALLAHLVGPEGTVTTIEYDPEVADAARVALAAYGEGRVKVVTGDGTLGCPEDAPFDRILVTAGAWDVARAWWDQLAPGGRLVLPLRLRGLTRVTAFERAGRVLRSVSVAEDGFIPMKGDGAVAEQNVVIGADRELTLRVDDGRPVDAAGLGAVLGDRPKLVWTTVRAPWAWTPNQDLWLACLPGLCRVFVDRDAVAAGRVPRPKDPWGAWGIFAGASLAYLTARRVGGVDEMPMLEVGACGFGPDGAHLAELLVGRVSAWQEASGEDAEVTIEARRKDATGVQDDAIGDALVVVDKRHHTFVVNAAQRTVATPA